MKEIRAKIFFFKSLLFELRSFYSLRISGYLFQMGWFRSFKEKRSIDTEGNIIPWLPYPVIDFLERRLSKDLSVFEYGCGASTIWLSARVKDLVSCEHNKEWYEKIKEQISSNVTLLYKNLDEGYSDTIKEYSDKFDIIFVDGLNRVNCIKNLLGALREDGIIILDDSFREEYDEGKQYLYDAGFRSIEITGPTPIDLNFGETSFFYKDNNIFKI